MNFLLAPLNLVTFFPLLGVLVLLFMKPEQKSAIRWTALITSLLTFIISLWAFFGSGQYMVSSADLQLKVQQPWISVAGWNIQYYLAADGLSILLVLLTMFM